MTVQHQRKNNFIKPCTVTSWLCLKIRINKQIILKLKNNYSYLNLICIIFKLIVSMVSYIIIPIHDFWYFFIYVFKYPPVYFINIFFLFINYIYFIILINIILCKIRYTLTVFHWPNYCQVFWNVWIKSISFSTKKPLNKEKLIQNNFIIFN